MKNKLFFYICVFNDKCKIAIDTCEIGETSKIYKFGITDNLDNRLYHYKKDGYNFDKYVHVWKVECAAQLEYHLKFNELDNWVDKDDIKMRRGSEWFYGYEYDDLYNYVSNSLMNPSYWDGWEGRSDILTIKKYINRIEKVI